MSVRVFDSRVCELGEGALWHPGRGQLFWFDILGRRLMTVEAGTQRQWQFDEHVSAAGWIDADTLLIASETALSTFDLATAKQDVITPLEADNPAMRSNDGRADWWGGFWIGTMGKSAEPKAGAIYRFYRGSLEKLFGDITIPNSICFSPDRAHAYFTDTVTGIIMRQTLDDEGWPEGGAEPFLDLASGNFKPDGSVIDAEGCLWNAQWGAARVARYSPEGQFRSAIGFPATQISCPAFGGPNMTSLFATSAREGLGNPGGFDGQTHVAETGVKGRSEPGVIL